MKRKKVGLALGSGAARGYAHLGVLQVLEEEGIQIDFISGSSIGALIGALYCSGIPVKGIIELAEEVEPWQWIDLSVPRKGLIAGRKIEEMIKKYTHAKTFDQLDIPLSIVATDLYSGKRCVLNKGYVYKAVRASIAIPGIFKPVEIDGRILVDGGVVDPVPVDLVKWMGADVIIGVNVSSFFTRDRIKSIYDIIVQSIDVMQNEILRLRGIEADIIIEPDLRRINPVTFNQADECIREGRKAALEVIDDIKKAINNPSRWGLLNNLGRKWHI